MVGDPIEPRTATLLMTCKDQKGLVHRISDFVFRRGGNILHADQHIDFETGLFLSRVEFVAIVSNRADLGSEADRFGIPSARRATT